MKACVAGGCFNKKQKASSLTFHEFPADIDKRYEWIKMVKKVNWSPEERDVLCSEHFEENCFFIGARGRKYLKRDAIPTVFKNTRSRRLLMRGSQQKKLVEKVVETSIPTNSTSRPSLSNSIAWCIEQDHNYSANITPELANEKLKIERFQNSKLRKRIEKLNRQLKSNEKALSYAMRMLHFSKKGAKTEVLLDQIDSENKVPIEILKRLNNKSNNPESVSAYTEPLKEFAMKLYVCSPTAYRLVRESFQLSLPSESIIKKWEGKAAGTSYVAPIRVSHRIKSKERQLMKQGKRVSKKKVSKEVVDPEFYHQASEYEPQGQLELFKSNCFDMEEFLEFETNA